ncbi:MAG: nickel pincer cofactor biosynthesis protein LarC [Bacteroidales bacterium]|jgi:hypothetical protein|nr:nickel pincer cofactor biosynthesis protein LarC [Bacteroidales bacterium]
MKILYYDCFSGISGDMNLGAMIDLGVSKTYLIGELQKLNLEGWKLVVGKDQRHGIYGTKVTVRTSGHEHHHRYLGDIEKIIEKSGLDREVKDLSRKIFIKVAEAEALVHGIPVSKVHFHEVGAIDSIVDIVGAAICYRFFKAEEVYVSPVELGGGFARCEHGLLPVPAPATAEIIKGIPVKTGGVDFEATTPTGAAIIAALGTKYGSGHGFRVLKTGYGIGHKEHPDVPNLLRVFLAETEEAQSGHDAILLECNIDDMNPEFFDHVSEKLFEAGASDVYLTNIIMKKGRPGSLLNVICESGNEEKLRGIIFNESTSVGIRSFPFRKATLERKFGIIKTQYGNVTVKRSYYRKKLVSYKPEYADCRRIALERGIPVKEVYNNIMALIVKDA